MEEQAIEKSPFKFSTPELEKVFSLLVEISKGNNIRMKKDLIELIENTRVRIDLESKDRLESISLHNEALAELKSAFDGLKLIDEKELDDMIRNNENR